MKISDAGIKIIKDFEGYHKKLPDGRCTTYYCPANVLTIGYGSTNLSGTHNIKPGDIWTHQQALDALANDIEKVYGAAVKRQVKVLLTQNQYDALVSFTYNLGEGHLSKSTLLRKLNAGDYFGASQEFKYWNKSKGKVLSGLVDRRAREAALFLKDTPSMPQRVTPSKPQSGWDWLKPWWLR